MQVIPVIFRSVSQHARLLRGGRDAERVQLQRHAHVREICALADLAIRVVVARGGLFAIGLQRAGECRAPFAVQNARIGGERRQSRQGQAIVGLAFLVAFLGWSRPAGRLGGY